MAAKKDKEPGGGGFFMLKACGAYRLGAEITTDPTASFAPSGKAPALVHPARLAAWLRDGIAEERAAEVESQKGAMGATQSTQSTPTTPAATPDASKEPKE